MIIFRTGLYFNLDFRFGALLGTQVHHRSVLGRCRQCSGNYEARGANGGKYEAQIVIFRKLAAVDRFSRFLRKWKAVEENWKAIEESRKAIEESGKPLKKIRKPLKKAESR